MHVIKLTHNEIILKARYSKKNISENNLLLVVGRVSFYGKKLFAHDSF